MKRYLATAAVVLMAAAMITLAQQTINGVSGQSVTGTAGGGFTGVLQSFVYNLTITASTTSYTPIQPGPTNAASANEASRNSPFGRAATITGIQIYYVSASGTQSSTGAVTVTLRDGGSATSCVVTVPAGATTPQLFSSGACSVAVGATDLLDLQWVNAATVTSIGASFVTVLYQ